MIQEISLLEANGILPVFTWANVPSFAIITGLNGSGKTQLLQLIHSQLHLSPPARVSFRPTTVPAKQVKLIDSQFLNHGLAAANWNDRMGRANEVYNYLHGAGHHDPNSRAASEEIVALISKKHGISVDDLKLLTAQKIETYLPYDYSRRFDSNVAVNHGDLAMRFMKYYEERCNLWGQKIIDEDEILKKIGPAPWDILNDLFKKYEFSHRVDGPTTFNPNYICRFKDLKSGVEVDYGSLSTGERMIASLLLWSFRSDMHEALKLLLLDEPDAHLHPSMTKMFIEIVRDVLVKKYGVQVIMTTHSPSTVALADEENLYKIVRNSGVKKCSKLDALEALTESLILVQPNTKIVLVEGETDIEPYNTFYAIAMREIKSIPKSKIFFRAVGKKSDGGGKAKVLEWAEKLAEIGWAVGGIVDDDGNNSKTPANVQTLKRYSVENYIYDPLVIFGCLLYSGYKPALEFASRFDLHQGDAAKISALPVSALTDVVNFIYEDLFEGSPKSHIDVSYGNLVIPYPEEFILKRGRDLKIDYVNKYKGAVNPSECIRIIHTLKFLPTDLIQLLQKL